MHSIDLDNDFVPSEVHHVATNHGYHGFDVLYPRCPMYSNLIIRDLAFELNEKGKYDGRY